MPHQFFQVVTANPNDVTGGGGCVCDPAKQIDCRPPYAVFPGNDMENVASPHVVICAGCAEAVVRACQGEYLAGGETGGVLTYKDPENPLQIRVQQYSGTGIPADEDDVPEV
jgi:hypothetical protein